MPTSDVLSGLGAGVLGGLVVFAAFIFAIKRGSSIGAYRISKHCGKCGRGAAEIKQRFLEYDKRSGEKRYVAEIVCPRGHFMDYINLSDLGLSRWTDGEIHKFASDNNLPIKKQRY